MPRQVRPTSQSQRFNPIGKPQVKSEKQATASTATAGTMAPKGPLPVTLLSGFLGAGKTTLLQHILTQDHGLRIAVVVNDIGAVNVDANIIKNHHLTQTEEKVVAMQNGCICCTLRGDLLEELVKLSKLQQFDYIIIESSGISEPEQVAETFDKRMAEQISLQAVQGDVEPELVEALEAIQKAGGLEKFAKLDTTVTVIDSFTMLNDFDTKDLLSTRRNDVTAEDERTVSDLMADQIEFANVIIMNKLDKVKNQKQKQELLRLVKSLNPTAKIIETRRGKVDAKEIVNTKLFNLEVAQTSYGWLRDLHEMSVRQINGRSVVAPQPETEEYNVGNFVYQRMRPFHPRRLQTLIYDKFILQLGEDEEDEDEGEDEEEDDKMSEPSDKEDAENEDAENEDGFVEVASAGGDSEATASDARDSNDTAASQSTDPTEPDEDEDEDDDLYAPEDDVILANRRAHPIFSELYRSKGTMWMATRPNQRGSWSQAGAMLTIVGDSPFYCTLDPEEYLTGSPEVDKLVKFDIEKGGEWGDRQTELVFIGLSLDRQRLSELLDECLVNDEEWEQWLEVMRDEELDLQGKIQKLLDLFDDGFPSWDDGDEHDHEGHDHGHDHSEKKVRNISEHAHEMQEIREVD